MTMPRQSCRRGSNLSSEVAIISVVGTYCALAVTAQALQRVVNPGTVLWPPKARDLINRR